jgi:hypothetical protein
MFVNSLWATFLMLQDAAAKSEFGWELATMWHYMGVPAKSVVILLFVISAWSAGFIVNRAIIFSGTRKQSHDPGVNPQPPIAPQPR